MSNLQNPTLPVVLNPIEIDRAIVDLQAKFLFYLSDFLTQGYGRAYKHLNVDSEKRVFVPEAYLGQQLDTQRYTIVTPDNDKEGQCFFLVNEETVNEFQQGQFNYLSYDVAIIFSINLEKVDPVLLETYYFQQEMVRRVRDVITRKAIGVPYVTEYINTKYMFEDVFKEFPQENQTQIEKSPLTHFRVNTKMTLREECGALPIDLCDAILQLISTNGLLCCTVESQDYTPAGAAFDCLTVQQIEDLRNRLCWTEGIEQQSCMLDFNNKLYGTSFDGGSNGFGYIWVMDISNPPNTQTIYNFLVPNRTGLINESGILYGCTDGGGDNGFGFVYSIDPTTLVFTQLASLSTSTGYRMNQFPTSPTFNKISTAMHAENGFLFAATRLGVSGNGGLFRYKISTNVITPLTPSFSIDGGAFQNFVQLGLKTYEYTMGSLFEMDTTSNTTTTITTDANPSDFEVTSNLLIFNSELIYGFRNVSNFLSLFRYDLNTNNKTLISAVSGLAPLDFFYRGLFEFNSKLHVLTTGSIYILDASFNLLSTTSLPFNAFCHGELVGGDYYLRLDVVGVSTLYKFNLTTLLFTVVPQTFLP